MPVLSPEQVGAYWLLAGGPREQTAAAIGEAYVESGFNTDAISSVGATGLWQIHPGGDQYKDPLRNAQAAVAKWRGGGNTFATAWHNFQGPGTAAKRAAYMPRAYRAASKVTGLDGPGLQNILNFPGTPIPIPLPDLPDIPGIPNPFDKDGGGGSGGIPNPLELAPGPLGDLAEAVGNIAELVRGLTTFSFDFLRRLLDPETWKGAGKILLGLIFLTIGIKRLFVVTTD